MIPGRDNPEDHNPEDTMSIFKHHRRAERAARARSTFSKRLLLRGLVAGTAVVGVVALAAASAVPALADDPGPPQTTVPTPTLTLGNGTGARGQWVATGDAYAPGLSDAAIWVLEGTAHGWSTIEYENGLTTSSRASVPFNPGGLLSAAGETERVLVSPQVGYVTLAVDPLKCGHEYQAFTWDPTDGFVFSNILTEPACS